MRLCKGCSFGGCNLLRCAWGISFEVEIQVALQVLLLAVYECTLELFTFAEGLCAGVVVAAVEVNVWDDEKITVEGFELWRWVRKSRGGG